MKVNLKVKIKKWKLWRNIKNKISADANNQINIMNKSLAQFITFFKNLAQ